MNNYDRYQHGKKYKSTDICKCYVLYSKANKFGRIVVVQMVDYVYNVGKQKYKQVIT